MRGDELYDVWAPPAAAWSPWCKPVLFAHMSDDEPPDEPRALSETSLAAFEGLPKRGERVAVVVDLPGAVSVAIGLILAERLGFRPVPLFNAAPSPSPDEPARVNVDVILAALVHGAEKLRKIPIESDAPPLFLLDAHRRFGDASGVFDNRSVSFPTDFPSANRLLSSGIRRALVIHQAGEAVEPDLAHTLRCWQEAGIPIWGTELGSERGAELVNVPKPSGFKRLLYRMLELAGLRRNVLGGFGGFPPQPGSSFGAGG